MFKILTENQAIECSESKGKRLSVVTAKIAQNQTVQVLADYMGSFTGGLLSLTMIRPLYFGICQ